MKTLTFKTNIKCGGCIAAVTPFLNEAIGAGNWQVDTQNLNKLLTADTTTAETVRRAVEKAGYKAELLNA